MSNLDTLLDQTKDTIERWRKIEKLYLSLTWVGAIGLLANIALMIFEIQDMTYSIVIILFWIIYTLVFMSKYRELRRLKVRRQIEGVIIEEASEMVKEGQIRCWEK